MTILCVGTTGCGKTSLLRILQQKCQNDYVKLATGKDPPAEPTDSHVPEGYIPSTIPTVGTDLMTLPVKPRGKAGSYNSGNLPPPSEIVTIREVGGAMAPIWNSYVEPAKTNAILYVVDSSSPETIGASTIQLLELLHHSAVENSLPVMIVFSKTDLKSSRSLGELQYLMRLDQIMRHGANTQLVKHTSFNVASEEKVDDIYGWVMQFTSPHVSHDHV